jgi:hypothetical protein
MNWWFITIIALGAISLGISVGKHGQTRKYDGWANLIGYVLEIIMIYFAIKRGFP